MRRNYPGQYPQESSNPFENIPTTEYIPQYLGLPMQELSDTANVFNENYSQFKIGKDHLETSMESLLTGINGPNKDHAERIIQNAREEINKIAEAKDFSRMGLDILSLTNQYSGRIKPLLDEKSKIDAHRKAIMESSLNEDDKKLELANLDYVEKNSALQYDQENPFKIVGGGFQAGSILTPYNMDDVVKKGIEGVRDAGNDGISAERANDIALNQIMLDKDLQSYLRKKTELSNNVIASQLQASGATEAEIKQALEANSEKIRETTLQPIIDQIFTKLHDNKIFIDNSGSSGSSKKGDDFEAPRRNLVSGIIGEGAVRSDYTTFTDFKKDFDIAKQNTANLKAEYEVRKKDGSLKKKVGNQIFDRSYEYEAAIKSAEQAEADYKNIYDVAMKNVLNKVQLMSGLPISEETFIKAMDTEDRNLKENINKIPILFGGTPMASDLKRETNKQGELRKYLDAEIKAQTEKLAETRWELAIYDDVTGGGDEFRDDRQFAIDLNSMKASLNYLRVDGSENAALAGEVTKNPEKYNIDPVSYYYDAESNKIYTRVDIQEKNADGKFESKGNHAYLDHTVEWMDKMTDIEKFEMGLKNNIHKSLPTKHEESKTIKVSELGDPELAKLVGDNQYMVVNDGNKVIIRSLSSDGKTQIKNDVVVGGKSEVREYIHNDIMGNLKIALQKENNANTNFQAANNFPASYKNLKDPITGAASDPSKIIYGYDFTSYSISKNWGNVVRTLLPDYSVSTPEELEEAIVKSKAYPERNENTASLSKFIFNSSKKYGVPVELIASIIKLESNFGTSNEVSKNYNNLGGITWNKNMSADLKGPERPSNEGGYYVKFNNTQESIDMIAKNIKNRKIY